jgi:phytoene dehydrogenase-like protein
VADKSIIIIGAGIAGLSAGCYARMNGYKTRIFELDTRPGGMCTSWKRKGYTIDGCFEFLWGSGPGNNAYLFWQELGALQGREIVHADEWTRVEWKDGKSFVFHTDMARLEQDMKKLAPEDTALIDELIAAARAFAVSTTGLPPLKTREVMGPLDGVKMLSALSGFMKLSKKWNGFTLEEYSQRFQNPYLREAITLCALPGYLPTGAWLTNLAGIESKTMGYPVGGSLEFARAIEQRYLGLGDEVQYKSRVEKVLVENDRAVGVRLADGTEHRANIVISAGDGRTTIFDMLDGKYIDDKIRGYYDNFPVTPPLLYIGLGVARTFDEPSSAFGTSFQLDEPVTIGGQELTRIPVHIYNFDPTLAPEGKTVMRVKLDSDYDYWKKLREDKESYKTAKEKVARQIIGLLDRRYPGFAAQVEMYDVATPVTFERYTNNWQGSYMGWKLTAQAMQTQMSKTLPGLGDFYMVGQWVEPGGGTFNALASGRGVVQIICKQDRKTFQASTP